MGASVFYVVSVTRVPAASLAQDRKAEAAIRLPQDERPEPDGNMPNAWLFQSNPALYKLRGALRTLREQVWTVSRYAKEIRAGDRVYLWEAGRRGGIVGLAEVIEPARLQAEPPEQSPFARVPAAFAGDRVRARLRIVEVLQPVVARQTIVSCPELNGLGVLRCSRGTNFRLSVDQWQALNALIHGSTTA